MTELPNDAVSTATNRLTREGATPGEDPREIDAERADLEHVQSEQAERYVRHADQLSEPAEQMGTTSTTEIDADDPLERDA